MHKINHGLPDNWNKRLCSEAGILVEAWSGTTREYEVSRQMEEPVRLIHSQEQDLDEIDEKILECLQEDARISNVELAERVGLSPAPCLRRVSALQKSGIIRKYVTLLDPDSVDLAVTVFVQISLDLRVDRRLDIFESMVVKRPEVVECYLMSGDADYLLRVVVPDVSAYEHFLKETLTRLECVAGVKSTFALKQVKYVTALPIRQWRPSSRRTMGSRRR